MFSLNALLHMLLQALNEFHILSPNGRRYHEKKVESSDPVENVDVAARHRIRGDAESASFGVNPLENTAVSVDERLVPDPNKVCKLQAASHNYFRGSRSCEGHRYPLEE